MFTCFNSINSFDINNCFLSNDFLFKIYINNVKFLTFLKNKLGPFNKKTSLGLSRGLWANVEFSSCVQFKHFLKFEAYLPSRQISILCYFIAKIDFSCRWLEILATPLIRHIKNFSSFSIEKKIHQFYIFNMFLISQDRTISLENILSQKLRR